MRKNWQKTAEMQKARNAKEIIVLICINVLIIWVWILLKFSACFFNIFACTCKFLHVFELFCALLFVFLHMILGYFLGSKLHLCYLLAFSTLILWCSMLAYTSLCNLLGVCLFIELLWCLIIKLIHINFATRARHIFEILRPPLSCLLVDHFFLFKKPKCTEKYQKVPNWNPEKLKSRETEIQRNWKAEKRKSGETKKRKNWKVEKLKIRETEKQRNLKTDKLKIRWAEIWWSW